MRVDYGNGDYAYVCTRADLANFPIVRYVRYRCIRCGRIDKSKRRAKWHRMWRWMTDLEQETK